MLKKVIKYTDFNGVDREEEFFFNFTTAEIAEKELSVTGGLSSMLEKISMTNDVPEMTKIFKTLILDSYGEKSVDGRRFIKKTPDGVPLSKSFEETEAYSILFIELANNPDSALSFIRGIMPADFIKDLPDDINNINYLLKKST